MDHQKLRNLVFDKTGIRIDIDDPVFALVALNEAVLGEAVERHVALLDCATQKLALAAADLKSARSAQSGLKPHPTPDLTHELTHELTPAFSAPREARLIALGAGIAILAALLVLAGQMLFFKPAPESMIEVPRLTPGQAAALKNGEKLNQAVQKLDQKTRDLIELEMQKK
jgi:hypothetical protein